MNKDYNPFGSILSDPQPFDFNTLAEWHLRQTDTSLAWMSGEDVGRTPTDTLLDEMAALRAIRGWHRITKMIGQHRPGPLPMWVDVRLEAIDRELASRGARVLLDRPFSVPQRERATSHNGKEPQKFAGTIAL
jgi:hypothetical protein